MDRPARDTRHLRRIRPLALRTREAVERELRRAARPIHRAEAPEAIDEMIAEGLVKLNSSGWIRRPLWRREVARRYMRARGTATTLEVADVLGCTDHTALSILRELGCEQVGMSTATRWRLPKVTHNCSECGDAVEEFCKAHPNAQLASTVMP